jgi:hypothetical protein
MVVSYSVHKVLDWGLVEWLKWQSTCLASMKCHKKKKKSVGWSWECSSGVELRLSLYKPLGSIPH